MRKRISILMAAILLMAALATGCSKSKAPESIGLNTEAQLLSEIGASFDLAANLVFEEGVDTEVTYTSSDETVATVSEDGLVTAAGYGVATILITSAADENVTAAMDIGVLDVTGGYAGEKYIAAMGCDIAIELTLEADGTFAYYRAPMLVAIEGGGQMPELEDQGTYTVEGTTVTFAAEMLGEYSAELSVSNGKCLLSGKFPTGGASTDIVLSQKVTQ